MGGIGNLRGGYPAYSTTWQGNIARAPTNKPLKGVKTFGGQGSATLVDRKLQGGKLIDSPTPPPPGQSGQRHGSLVANLPPVFKGSNPIEVEVSALQKGDWDRDSQILGGGRVVLVPHSRRKGVWTGEVKDAGGFSMTLDVETNKSGQPIKATFTQKFFNAQGEGRMQIVETPLALR